MGNGTNVLDVTDSTFEREVVDRSESVPVIVDLWAPWCGPCKTLGPILEKVAGEHEGELVLAKVDVDENPAVAQALGVREIPSVKAIHNRSLVDEFTGAMAEQAVREFCRRLLPTDEDRIAQQGLVTERAGQFEGAEQFYRRALGVDANHPLARLGLGRILAEKDPEAALGELDRVPTGTPERDEADRIAARLRLTGGDDGERAQLEERIERDPADLDARIELGKLFAAAQEYEAALDHLLEAVRRDRHYADDSARKAMLDIFEVLGPEDPLTDTYRTRLSRILFS